MKLNLFFTLIDLLVLFAYPFVFIWSKLQYATRLNKHKPSRM